MTARPTFIIRAESRRVERQMTPEERTRAEQLYQRLKAEYGPRPQWKVE